MPLVGGLQIFFLNSPDIDFALDGIVNIPGLKHFIKRKISKIIAKKLVFPNKIPVRLSKSLDASELKSLEPEVSILICLLVLISNHILLYKHVKV